MKIQNLYHGMVLAESELTQDGNQIPVLIQAEENAPIKVNGKPATYVNGFYSALAAIDGYRNTIAVKNEQTGEAQTIVVYYPKKAQHTYRLSLDDNIRFLKNIYEKQFASLFEDPYLGFMKSLHDRYGTKIHINLYYEYEDFNLSQFPDRYRDEWQENRDWITLAFHAKADQPDMPYKHTTYEKIRQDYLLVMREVERFAGPGLTSPVIDVHWGECPVEGVRALRSLGIRAISGYFILDQDGEPYVSYHLSKQQIAQFAGRTFFRDDTEDILFLRTSIILNDYTPQTAIEFLDDWSKNSVQSCFLELMIHEQYFYPDYVRYLPQFREIVEKAVQWATTHEYRPVFAREAILEW